MKYIVDGLTRSTLITVSIWMFIATALSVAAVALSFYTSHVNEARLHGAMEDVMRTAFVQTVKHRPLQETANSLAAIGKGSGISVAVFDDTGRRLAGDTAGLAMPMPMMAFHARHVSTLGLQKQPSNMNEPPPPFGGMGAVGIVGAGPGLSSSPFGDVGNAAWVRIPNGFALLRLTESSATMLERDYIIAMIALLVVGIVGVPLLTRRHIRRQLEPLVNVENALHRLGEGDYSKIEVVGHKPGELTLVEAYNAAADRLSAALKRQAETESNMRQFVAEAGHELRTPLTVLMGFIEVLQEGAVKEYALAQRILTSIAIEGQRMRALILKLLLLARLDATSTERNELVDVGAVASEVVTGFQSLPGGERISFSAEPRTFVNATSSEIRELLSNLLDNALKHAPGSATRADVAHVNGSVELSVADDGPGMMPDFRQRAFDRFTRGDDRGSVPGSGLGLAIVKRIVDRTHGTIELDSTPGRGTKVSVRLPAAQVDAASGAA